MVQDFVFDRINLEGLVVVVYWEFFFILQYDLSV